MALIKCPECNKDISDKAEICVGCGFPIRIHLEALAKEVSEKEGVKKSCRFCGSENIDKDGYCDDCGMKVESREDVILEDRKIINISEAEEIYTICPSCNFHNVPGVYKCLKCGHKYKLYEYEVIDEREGCCPSCRSSRIRAFTEKNVIIPQKVKNQTSYNLNPFKPLTLFNHTQKVVRKEVAITETKFICDNCGNIFR